jgi:hypothetical protein
MNRRHPEGAGRADGDRGSHHQAVQLPARGVLGHRARRPQDDSRNYPRRLLRMTCIAYPRRLPQDDRIGLLAPVSGWLA